MNTNVKIAAALIAVLALAIVSYNLVPGDGSRHRGRPSTSSPTASHVPSPTPSPPALTEGRPPRPGITSSEPSAAIRWRSP